MIKSGRIIRSNKDEPQVIIDLTNIENLYGYTTTSLARELGVHRDTLTSMKKAKKIPACYYNIFRNVLPDIFPPIEEMEVDNGYDKSMTLKDYEERLAAILRKIDKRKKEISKLQSEYRRHADAYERLKKKVMSGGEDAADDTESPS